LKLFLYGTLADPAALGRCAGRPVSTQPLPALLAGCRRVLLRGARCFYGDAPTRVAWAPDEKLMTLRSRSF
jgi:hypothetical protein